MPKIIQMAGPPGVARTIKLFTPDTHTLVDAQAATHSGDDGTSLHSAEFDDLDAGRYRAEFFAGTVSVVTEHVEVGASDAVYPVDSLKTLNDRIDFSNIEVTVNVEGEGGGGGGGEVTLPSNALTTDDVAALRQTIDTLTRVLNETNLIAHRSDPVDRVPVSSPTEALPQGTNVRITTGTYKGLKGRISGMAHEEYIVRLGNGTTVGIPKNRVSPL